MTHVHEAAARNRPRTGGYLTKRTEYMSIVQEETKENVVLLNKDLYTFIALSSVLSVGFLM